MARISRIKAVPGGDAAAKAATKTRPARGAAPVDAPPAVDLNDAETQENILYPTSFEVTVAGGVPKTLSPLPARDARSFVGLLSQVLSETVGPQVNFAPGQKISGVIIESRIYTDKFATYAARATFPTAFLPTMEDIATEANAIAEKSTYEELVKLIDRMITLNNVIEVMTRAKK